MRLNGYFVIVFCAGKLRVREEARSPVAGLVISRHFPV